MRCTSTPWEPGASPTRPPPGTPAAASPRATAVRGVTDAPARVGAPSGRHRRGRSSHTRSGVGAVVASTPTHWHNSQNTAMQRRDGPVGRFVRTVRILPIDRAREDPDAPWTRPAGEGPAEVRGRGPGQRAPVDHAHEVAAGLAPAGPVERHT